MVIKLMMQMNKGKGTDNRVMDSEWCWNKLWQVAHLSPLPLTVLEEQFMYNRWTSSYPCMEEQSLQLARCLVCTGLKNHENKSAHSLTKKKKHTGVADLLCISGDYWGKYHSWYTLLNAVSGKGRLGYCRQVSETQEIQPMRIMGSRLTWQTLQRQISEW